MSESDHASSARYRGGQPGLQPATLMRLATGLAVVAALTLVVLKAAAWLLTGSVALLSSMVDSLLDAGASLINLFAVRLALTPADHEHRFGHGKAEPLAGLAQAAFVVGSAVFLVIEAVGRLLSPAPVAAPEVGLVVMAASIGITLALVAFQKLVVQRTGSVAIAADSLHYIGDVLINLAVIVAMVLSSRLGWHLADPAFALAISAVLVHSAARIARRSIDLLMDHEFSEDDRLRILEIATSAPDVRGAHDLRTRSSGTDRFIQLHLVLDPNLPLRHAHAIADKVESTILEWFPGADVIIHQDPAGLDEAHDPLQIATTADEAAAARLQDTRPGG